MEGSAPASSSSAPPAAKRRRRASEEGAAAAAASSSAAPPAAEAADPVDAEDAEGDEDAEVNFSESSESEMPDDDDSSDDSEDDAPRNRIGNVPLSWYDDEDHVGYDLAGEKIMRTITGGEIDALLESKDNPNAWRTIKDHKNQREIVLTDTDLEIIRRLRKRMYPSKQTDATEMPEFDNPEAKIHPVYGDNPPKRRFIPSKWERMKVKRLVSLLKEGKIRPPPPPKPEVWDLWADEAPQRRRAPRPLPAPKMALPGHAESYNPPSEYLMTEEEKKTFEEQDESERTVTHVPEKYDALRRVPAYKEFIQERFKRCLDLYLVPRALRQKMNIDPASLLPKLPSPKDLRPFPTHVSVSYEGHRGMIRGVSVDASGQWLATVSADNTMIIWEVASGRPFRSMKFKSTATAVAWNPKHLLLAVAADDAIFFVDPGLEAITFRPPAEEGATEEGAAKEVTVESLLTFKPSVNAALELDADGNPVADGAKARVVRWAAVEKDDPMYACGCRLKIPTDGDVTQLVWHGKGSYCAAVSPKANAPSNQCIIHALQQQKSMRPFSKLKGGQVQSCAFHPNKPHFIVATQKSVRLYDLQKQMPLKQLVSGAKWISSISVHSTGDHVVVGSYDRRLIWFDLDFGNKPYKSLQYHDRAVRSVAFHPGKYPLLAAASDDATVSILHAKVYSDLLQSPMIVPVKRLRDHAVHQGFGVLSCVWHPHQPWLFTVGADHRVYLWA